MDMIRALAEFGQSRRDTGEREASPELSFAEAEQFADLYLTEVSQFAREDEDHPLIFYVQQLNRFAPENLSLLVALNQMAQGNSMTSVTDRLNLEGRIEENVERPLDYADSYHIQPYHWRRRSLQEHFTLPLYDLRFQLTSDSKKAQTVQDLASFYLQAAFQLYQHSDHFMRLATADVFHTRGVKYAHNAILFAWQDHAKMHGYNPDGFHYPHGEYEPTLEYRAFRDPLMDAVTGLSKPASKFWEEFEKLVPNPRYKHIAGVIAEDRKKYFQDFYKGPKRNATLENSRAVLTQVKVHL
jgi:hypothetical protein